MYILFLLEEFINAVDLRSCWFCNLTFSSATRCQKMSYIKKKTKFPIITIRLHRTKRTWRFCLFILHTSFLRIFFRSDSIFWPKRDFKVLFEWWSISLATYSCIGSAELVLWGNINVLIMIVIVTINWWCSGSLLIIAVLKILSMSVSVNLSQRTEFLKNT